jgi:small conductance mechanosensitive channel
MNNLSFDQLQNWQAYGQTILTTFGLRLVGAIALFFVGRWAASILQKTTRKLLIKANTEFSLVSFVSNCAYYGTIAFTVLAIMGLLGIETTSLVAILGAASVAVGLALQGSLSNFAAGLLLVIFYPFRVGDWIDGASVSGIVEEIQLFTTHVRTPDNRLVIIPNGKLTNDNVTNYSVNGMLRVDMVVGVDYEENLQRVKKLIAEVLAADPHILNDPKPTIGVLDLGENDIRLAVQPWTSPENFWTVRYQTCEHLVERFRQEGIQTPSNKPEVHIHSFPKTA